MLGENQVNLGFGPSKISKGWIRKIYMWGFEKLFFFVQLKWQSFNLSFKCSRDVSNDPVCSLWPAWRGNDKTLFWLWTQDCFNKHSLEITLISLFFFFFLQCLSLFTELLKRVFILVLIGALEAPAFSLRTFHVPTVFWCTSVPFLHNSFEMDWGLKLL